MAPRDTKLTKSIGEHHVCAELARHGWAAALTRDGLARTDVLAVRADDEERRTLVELQVKTTVHDGKKISWLLGEKSQQRAVAPREWFVLVASPRDLTAPVRSFVVPRDHIAAAAWIGHMTWLTDPAAKAGKRNAGVSQSRISVDVFERYEGCWNLLDTESTDDVPVLLPGWMRTNAELERVGLPEGHPWRERLPEWQPVASS